MVSHKLPGSFTREQKTRYAVKVLKKNPVTKVTLILSYNDVDIRAWWATCCNWCLWSNFSPLSEEGTAEENWISFFIFSRRFSFIDVYCAKTIMEICYALGAMEEIFMAVFFYSPGYERQKRNLLLFEVRKKVLFWWEMQKSSKRTLLS